ncbi:MAG: hypothetical protein RLZZ347_101 [Candidatus Parcubacteria bacterium]|jgi:hypothetical protein
MLFTLFRNAGATGHVFFLAGGKTESKGVAFSGLVWPWTTVAVVPGTAQVIDFSVEARTQDKQTVTVTGNLKLVLVPETAVSKFDFTVQAKTGGYLAAWQQALRTMVVEHVLAPIHGKARELTVEQAISAHKEFETAVKLVVTSEANPLVRMGITVESCSIARVEADDDDVAKAIGSRERQMMLTESDAALHNRQMKAVENQRTVRTFEAATVLKLEEERAKLLLKQAENKKTEATMDADATKIRMAPLADVDPGKLLGAALLKMAETGRIGNLSVGPELLAALKEKV